MSTEWKTHQVDGYAAIVLSGHSNAVKTAKSVYKAIGITTQDSSPTSLILQDVKETDFQEVEDIADSNGLSIVGKNGSRKYLVRSRVPIRKALRLSLQPGKWYFAEYAEESYPLVYIRDMSIEKIRNGDTTEETQVFDVELLSPDDSTPISLTYNAKDLARLGLRPASTDDFDEYGIIAPPLEQFVPAFTRQAPNLANLANFDREG